MRNEQDRWENILANVKQRGGRIRRRRQFAAGLSVAVVALALALSAQIGRSGSVDEVRRYALNDAEIEIVLLEHDIMLDDMGVY